jgi:hypothetical protein
MTGKVVEEYKSNPDPQEGPCTYSLRLKSEASKGEIGSLTITGNTKVAGSPCLFSKTVAAKGISFRQG